MKYLTIIFLLLFTVSANAQAISDDDLSKAYDSCKDHKSAYVSRATPKKWGDGWEHCEAIEIELNKRKADKEKSIQFSKDIADKLKKK